MSTNKESTRRLAPGRVKLMFVAFAALLALAVSACGSDDGDSGTTDEVAATDATTGDGTEVEAASPQDPASWCGDEPITLGIYDGGGLNSWSAESKKQVEQEAAKCDAIEDTIVVDAGFDPQVGVSGLQGMIAQGANAIVLIPDAGVCAELPQMKQATSRGIAVVPWAADPCGTAPEDFQTYVDWDVVEAGRGWAEWTAEQLDGKGNILYLGGPAGNPVDAGQVEGMYEVLEDYPDINVLENVTTESWPVTNWDPAEARKVTAALLAKNPQIDAIISSFGTTTTGAIKAFQAEGRAIPSIATIAENELSCIFDEAAGTPDEFQLATYSNRNWLGRIAVRKAVAGVNGIEEPGKDIVALPLFEDSTNPDLQPICDPSQPPDAYLSNQLPAEELEAIVYE